MKWTKIDLMVSGNGGKKFYNCSAVIFHLDKWENLIIILMLVKENAK
ncbi:MAG: hypothetical protein ABIL22_06470 [candidate division WOR-3 bacterium]